MRSNRTLRGLEAGSGDSIKKLLPKANASDRSHQPGWAVQANSIAKSLTTLDGISFLAGEEKPILACGAADAYPNG
jgi:hypothetical protein